MIASQDFVKTTFNHFNALCFEGVLPVVPIALTKACSFLGKMEYKSRRDFFGIISSHYDFRLKISTGFDLSQEELEDVIIHEMIHYYIAWRNISLCPDITCIQWYGTLDPFFDRYPRSKTPRVYKITEEEIMEHLGSAVVFSCDGHNLIPNATSSQWRSLNTFHR